MEVELVEELAKEVREEVELAEEVRQEVELAEEVHEEVDGKKSISPARFSSRPSSAVKSPETATLVPKASPSSLLHCWISGASSGAAVRDKSSSKTPPVRIRCRSNFSFLMSPFGEFYIWIS
ncbi:hypothetical protein ACLB2K_045245 [Fragaria x ananassa]